MNGFFNLSGGARLLLALCVVVVLAEGGYISYVMGGSMFKILSSKTSCERVLDKWRSVNQKWAMNREVYSGPITSADFVNTNLTQASDFKKEIDDAVAKGPNFAGKYVVAQWSCGDQCQNHAIVNVESGKIVSMGPRTEAGVGISVESPILITNPQENFPSVATIQKANLQTLVSLAKMTREYYVLIGDSDSNVGIQRLCAENPFEGMGI